MKYKTFRRGVIVLSVLVGGAGLWGVVRAVNGAHEAQPVVPIVAPTPGPAGSSPADTAEHSTAAPLEPYERLLKGACREAFRVLRPSRLLSMVFGNRRPLRNKASHAKTPRNIRCPTTP